MIQSSIRLELLYTKMQLKTHMKYNKMCINKFITLCKLNFPNVLLVIGVSSQLIAACPLLLPASFFRQCDTLESTDTPLIHLPVQWQHLQPDVHSAPLRPPRGHLAIVPSRPCGSDSKAALSAGCSNRAWLQSEICRSSFSRRLVS